MGTYLNENNIKLFSCKILSTCVKLLNEFDELKKNETSEKNEKKLLQIKKN
jgi:hypothetical protein